MYPWCGKALMTSKKKRKEPMANKIGLTWDEVQMFTSVRPRCVVIFQCAISALY